MPFFASSPASVKAAALAWLVLAGVAAAQTPAEEAVLQGAPSEGRRLGDHPDLSGSWEVIDPLRRQLAAAELTPQAQSHAREDAARAQARLAAGYQVGIGAYLCQLGVGMPWNGQSEPIDIVQTPELTLITIERLAAAWRVYTDGRTLPADLSSLPKSYNGYSVGRWEGETFVVETRGIRTLDTFPRPGVRGGGYTTPDTKLTLKLRLINEGRQLEMIATFEDPAVWVKPHQVQYIFFRNEPGTYAFGYFCDPTDPTATVTVEAPPGEGAAP